MLYFSTTLFKQSKTEAQATPFPMPYNHPIRPTGLLAERRKCATEHVYIFFGQIKGIKRVCL